MPKFSDPTSRVAYLLARGRTREAIAASEISLGMLPKPRWLAFLLQGRTREAIAAHEAELGMPRLRSRRVR
jgi:hypothetical protein